LGGVVRTSVRTAVASPPPAASSSSSSSSSHAPGAQNAQNAQNPHPHPHQSIYATPAACQHSQPVTHTFHVDPEQSGKLLVLYRMMLTLKALKTGERIVVVSNYTQTLDLVETMCAANNWASLRLGTVPRLSCSHLLLCGAVLCCVVLIAPLDRSQPYVMLVVRMFACRYRLLSSTHHFYP
jgi:hypothetical protein